MNKFGTSTKLMMNVTGTMLGEALVKFKTVLKICASTIWYRNLRKIGFRLFLPKYYFFKMFATRQHRLRIYILIMLFKHTKYNMHTMCACPPNI